MRTTATLAEKARERNAHLTPEQLLHNKIQRGRIRVHSTLRERKFRDGLNLPSAYQQILAQHEPALLGQYVARMREWGVKP